MKRRSRWMLNLLAIIFAIISISVIASWVRSYWITDYYQLLRSQYLPERQMNDAQDFLAIDRGHIRLQQRSFHYTLDETATVVAGQHSRWQWHHSSSSAPKAHYVETDVKQGVIAWLGFDFERSVGNNGRYAELDTIVIVPFWFVSVLPIAILLWICVRIRQKNRRIRIEQGLCGECGYDLRARKGRCPECGTAISEVQGATPRSPSGRG